jgi:GAF domain-containing protein
LVLARIHLLVVGPEAELKFLDCVIRVVVDVLGVQHGKILALESSAPWLTVKAGVGWNPGTVGHARVPLGSRSQAGLTLRMGASVVCPDLARTRRFSGATLLRQHGIVSTASAVIGAAERPYGVMSVHTTRQYDFTPAETQFLSRAAHLVNVGIRRRSSALVAIDAFVGAHALANE